jgi:hypothetical protein
MKTCWLCTQKIPNRAYKCPSCNTRLSSFKSGAFQYGSKSLPSFPAMFWICAIGGASLFLCLAFHDFRMDESAGGFRCVMAAITFLILSPIAWIVADLATRLGGYSTYYEKNLPGIRFLLEYGPQVIALCGVVFAVVSAFSLEYTKPSPVASDSTISGAPPSKDIPTGP